MDKKTNKQSFDYADWKTYNKQTRFKYDDPWLAGFILKQGYPVVAINRNKYDGNKMFVEFEYDYATHCKLYRAWEEERARVLGYK